MSFLLTNKLLLRLKNKQLSKYDIICQAFSSLKLWDQELTNEMRFSIESHWKDKINQYKDTKDDSKEKFYVLAMFPYPSGNLHMGHVRVYTISDTVARFHRMHGRNVIHPMGWDAFGLPAENAAIERQIDPAEWTKQNIQNMRAQLDKLGCLFDWDREITTCNPEYYKWTQDLFLKLYEKGLVYQKEAYVNWDPVDQTVLAEEQVDADNRSWRSGAKVEKRLLKQWFVRTTKFAKSLLEGLDDPGLKEWKDIIKIQKNWIGECNGYSFEFQLISDNPQLPKTLNLWTDKPEFIESAKFIAISPNCMLNQLECTDDKNKIHYSENGEECIVKLDAKVLNPFNGEELPIFVTNKVTFPIGRDNYLGIPCAEMSDYEFSEIVGIPFRRHNIRTYDEQQKILSEVLSKARDWKIGGYPVSSKLNDWLISRQRYWGTPIPIIHCDKCGPQPVPRDQLPVLLPHVRCSSSKVRSLINAKEWLETSCPKCGNSARRESDTMDTFVDSSWYYLRFLDPKNNNEMFSSEIAKKNMPVDLYVGGKEHGVLHLYFARFINHFLHSEGLVATKEPFKQLLVQGMVMGRTYQVKGTQQYLKAEEVQKVNDKYVETKSGKPVTVTWKKMSKSKHNGVDPMDLFAKYGTDTTRLLISADVAPTSSRNWSDETIPGIINWQHRLWLSISKFIKLREEMTLEDIQNVPTNEKFLKDEEYMFDSRNYFIKTITFNITGSQQLSVALSRLQGLTNSLRKVSLQCLKNGKQFERALAAQIIMLAPFTPHFAAEMWAGFCSVQHHLIDENEVQLNKDVMHQHWPEIDMNYNMELSVFVNNQPTLKLKIPRYVLDEMTSQSALEHVIKHNVFQKRIKDFDITDVKLHSKKSCDGRLYVTTKRVTEKKAEL